MKNKFGKKDYLINEMRSYNYLMSEYINKINYHTNRAVTLNRRLRELENELNSFGYSSPTSRIEVIKTSSSPSKRNRILEVMNDVDHIKKRIKELDDVRLKDLEYICERIEYIDSLLDTLTKVESQFLIDMYINQKGLKYMKSEYGIEYDQDVYRTAKRYVGYMIYGKKDKKYNKKR